MIYLFPSEERVISGLEGYELQFAKDQPQYMPLKALRSLKDNGAVLTRWIITEEVREAILAGNDLYLEQLTFHQPLQPVRLSIGIDVAQVKAEYGIDD